MEDQSDTVEGVVELLRGRWIVGRCQDALVELKLRFRGGEKAERDDRSRKGCVRDEIEKRVDRPGLFGGVATP